MVMSSSFAGLACAELAVLRIQYELTTQLYTVALSHNTGKTIAFVIGMLAKINLSHACTQALCLTPTRELANQILSDAVRPLSSRLRVTYEEALPGREISRGEICRSQVRICMHSVFVLCSIVLVAAMTQQRHRFPFCVATLCPAALSGVPRSPHFSTVFSLILRSARITVYCTLFARTHRWWWARPVP